jgi:membrane protein
LGAVIASGGWIAFSAAFSLYVSHSSMTVYGSLTTIVLSMLWLYICISILFLGAIINKYTFLKRKEKN